MITKPKLQLITGVYNGGKRFEEFLNCISNQTYENLELILIDDCSTDSYTLKVLDSLLSNEIEFKKKLQFIRNECNLGLEKTFQKGLDVSTANYVAFPETDDYIDLDFYEILMDRIITFDADVVEGLMLEKHWNEDNPLFIEEEPIFDENSAQVTLTRYGFELDYTHSWYYVFTKKILSHDNDIPVFFNAVKYAISSIPFYMYKSCKVPLDCGSFYIYNNDSYKCYTPDFFNKGSLGEEQIRLFREFADDLEKMRES